MNFNYSEEQLLIAASAKDFAEQYIRPNIMEWDEAQIFPVELFKKLEKWVLWEFLSMKNMEAQD